MLKGFLIAAALGSGIVGLIGPAFAQNTGASTAVETDRVVVSREVIAAHRVVVPAPKSVTKYYAPIPGGGFGGSVGGYYINGTTRADNRPLPGGVWPYR
jgi:hypothetical protein